MKEVYNICMTIIIVVMTLCITYVTIHSNLWFVLIFLVIPALISEFLTYDKEAKK